MKYAFENDWIGPSVQVIIGIVAGIVVAGWSERFRRHGFAGFSYSLKAVGAGALYLSLWASFALYSLVPAAVAFCGMVVVTAAMAALAVWQSAEVLAGLALVGGFLTPVLVSTGGNQEVALLSYLLLLDAAALLLQRYRSWPRILFGSFIGTELIFVFWYVKFYSDDQFAVTVSFLSAFFALVCRRAAGGGSVSAKQRQHAAQNRSGAAGDERVRLLLRDLRHALGAGH